MKRFVISESERKEIRKLYGLMTEEDAPQTTTTFTGCTFNEGDKDIMGYDELMTQYQNDYSKISQAITETASKLKTSVPQLTDRSACQAGLNKIRPSLKDKQFIIIDANKQTIYIFDKDGNYKSGDWLITGKDSFTGTPEQNEFYEFSKMSYKDRVNYLMTKKGKTKKDAEILAIKQEGSRFATPGIYQSATSGTTYGGYSGWKGGPNLFNLFNLNTPQKITDALTFAMHGVKPDQERLSALSKASEIPLGSELPKDINLDLSSGCLNLNEKFVNDNRDLLQNAYVYIIKEDENNYYVFNPAPLIDYSKCHSNELLQIHQAPAT